VKWPGGFSGGLDGHRDEQTAWPSPMYQIARVQSSAQV